MVVTPHALAGALAGSRLPAPAALAAGIASHYLLDRVPHRDYRLGALGGVVLGADLAAAALLVAATPAGSRAGAIGGLLPDLACIATRRAPRSGLLHRHRRLHDANHTRRRWPLGAEVATQAATCAIALAVLRRIGRGGRGGRR